MPRRNVFRWSNKCLLRPCFAPSLGAPCLQLSGEATAAAPSVSLPSETAKKFPSAYAFSFEIFPFCVKAMPACCSLRVSRHAAASAFSPAGLGACRHHRLCPVGPCKRKTSLLLCCIEKFGIFFVYNYLLLTTTATFLCSSFCTDSFKTKKKI